MMENRKCAYAMASTSMALLILAGAAFGQTAEEKNDLKLLGNKGFVVYGAYGNTTGDISRYDLDGTGEFKPKVLTTGQGPTVSADGRSIAFFRCTSAGKSCDIFVMDNDGKNLKKINKTNMTHMMNLVFSGTPAEKLLMFNVGPKSVRTGDGDGFSQQVHFMDMDGKTWKIVDKSSGPGGSYDYINDLSFVGDILTYRYAANVYTANISADRTKLSNEKKMRQGCATTFNPTANRMVINKIDHKGVYFYKRTGTTGNIWSSDGEASLFTFKTSNYRWSNSEDWIVANVSESGGGDVYSYNPQTKKKIKLTFGLKASRGNLFLGEPASGASTSLLSNQSKSLRIDGSTRSMRYNLLGARLPMFQSGQEKSSGPVLYNSTSGTAHLEMLQPE